MIQLKGITWDHPRGYAPLRACARWGDIEVDWQARSLKDFGDASIAELAAEFDLIILDHPHSGEAATGILLPLDAHIDAATLAEIATDSPSASFRSYNFEGHQWALPIDAACQVGAYRPDLVRADELPQTWEDFISFASALRKRGLWAAMALCPTDTLCSFLTLSAQLGDAPETDQWIAPATVVQVIKQLKAIRDVCHPDSLSMNPIAVYEAMSKGDEAMAYCPLAFGYTDYARPNASGHRLDFTGIPGTHSTLLGGAGIGVSAKTTEPAAAMRYAAHLCGAEIQSGSYVEHNGQPAHPAALTSEAANRHTGNFLSNTRSTIELAYTRPRLAGWPEFQEYLGDAVHQCLLDEASIDETVKDLATKHLQFLPSETS
jgi:multiple sugar transport system substrate-binding protein